MLTQFLDTVSHDVFIIFRNVDKYIDW